MNMLRKTLTGCIALTSAALLVSCSQSETETEQTMPERTASESTDPTDFSDLEEKDSGFYTAQGSGSMAGTSFTTEDGSVACHITGRAAACMVPGNQAAWDNADRADGGASERLHAVSAGQPRHDRGMRRSRQHSDVHRRNRKLHGLRG